jgi:PKD repeat protein
VTTNNAGAYSVVVANAAGSITSSVATLTVIATWTLVGWSDMGIRETDGSDVSVYSLMPPFSTIHAQLMSGGKLVTNASGVTVTYQAVADATGSINTTSQGKGNFYQFAKALYGVTLSPDQGLAGFAMPGATNQPQVMSFDAPQKWFSAGGIPVTPYDDQGRKNYYPMMRLVARDASGKTLASADIVLPVTDEMDCRSCHASGSPGGRPPEGWVWDTDPVKDYKLNILRSHDDHQLGSAPYASALSAAGYSVAGLVATVTQNGKPISCIRCHVSNALPGSGATGNKPLTQVMHTKHAYVADPELGVPLFYLSESAACLRCHAGPDTRRLRGVHHNTVNSDGTRSMQCQSCHGNMTDLGTAGRQGWLEEPKCQSCHTGTATANNGQLRYTSVVDDVTGLIRQAVDQTFATQPNTPASGLSLYRFSQGHGGLKCQACHGATHVELASSQPNDNVQSMKLQGHAGTLADCGACHAAVPRVSNGGPHGLHPLDQTWASNHENGGRTSCQSCHGPAYLGTVLSAMQGTRTMGGRSLWQGNQIGCYNCHNGAGGGDNGTGIAPAAAINASASTEAETPVSVTLQANGTELAFRAVSQPAHGTASVSGNVATYYPEKNFVGSDSFTFAANNGWVDSNLGTISLTVTPGNCVLTASALAPTAALPNSAVPFRANASLSKCVSAINYAWDFGDGSAPVLGTNVSHVYTNEGDYTWVLNVTADGASQAISNAVTISARLGPPLILTITTLDPWTVQLAWPSDRIPTSLEHSFDFTQPYSWAPVVDAPVLDWTGTNWTVPADILEGNQFWRLRRLP